MTLFKRIVLLFAFCLVPTVSFAEFQHSGRNAGIGIGVGSQDGISGYYRLSRENFVQGMLSFHHNNFLFLSGDYGFTYLGVFQDAPWLVPYLGVGGFFASVERKGRKYFDEDVYRDGDTKRFTVLGARFPIGLQLFVPKMPLQIGLEIVPIMTLTPGTDFELDHLITFRFVF